MDGFPNYTFFSLKSAGEVSNLAFSSSISCQSDPLYTRHLYSSDRFPNQLPLRTFVGTFLRSGPPTTKIKYP